MHAEDVGGDMSQEYFIQANNHETIKVTKEEYRANNRIKYMDGDESQKKQVTMDYLGGIRANSGAVIPGKDALEKTSIKSRKAYGEAIRNAEKERFEKIDKYTDKALGNSNIDKSCVKNIAAFFTGKKNMDRALIKGYTEMPQNSEVVLKYCISDFLTLPIENLNISSPKKLAAKASVLEKLSAKHEAIVRLIVEHREDYDNLPEDLRDRFENKLGEANGLINYYRLMKSLMTDSYYLNNDVSKLSRQDPKKDTPDQKRVRTLLLGINGGALALKTKGTEILNRYLDSMAGTLQTNVVSTDNIRLSKDLLSHKEKLEGLSISQYLDRLEHEGNVDGFDKPKAKGLFERGKSSITLLNLPESVENSYGKIGAILNQLDFVNDLTREKNDHKGFYYMEQDFRDIAILDEVEKLSAPLKDLKEVILSHGGISEDGTLEIGKLSDKQRKDLQMRYTGAITKYRDIFAAINEYRSDLYLNPPEDADMDAAFTKFRTYADKSVKERGRTRIPDKKEQENLREDLRLLYLTLSEGRYSDYVIYNNAPKIIDLKIKCQAFLTKAESERLDSFVYLANELRINKKKIDLSRALSCKGATNEELLNLSREKEELEAYEKDIAKISDAATLKNKEVQRKLRNEAQKMEYDSADFRAEASNYLFHEEWLKNTYRKKEKFSFGSIYDYVKGKTILGLTRFVSWVYSRKRTHHHGAELYDVARRNLARMPQELKNFGEEGADQSITFGDGTYAPKVELNKYFKDPMKMQLYNDYREIAGLMQAGKNYPESMQDAAEALSGYCEVRGLVNRDTYEMEHAFLEKFNLSVNKMLEEEQGEYPLIRRKIHEAYKHYVQMSCGTLGSHLKPGELKAIEETKAVYTQKTFFGDSEESNMRNLPLFPHSPNLNDIKQGVIGNCYMMAAVQTILSTEPESIRDMFLDLGDGNVVSTHIA